jgi:hypothetical protein
VGGLFKRRGKMINKKIFLFSALLLISTSLFTTGGKTQSLIPYGGGVSPKPGTHAPIITHAYAEDKGVYGIIWKIYIEAEDTDADMHYVAVVVNQTGQGRYPTDRIFLDPQHRKHLKGFLQWNTSSSRGAALDEGTQITLRISIIDKAGNESNEAIFPYAFVSGVRGQDELPAPFDEKNIPRIGYISIDLVNPNRG